ncbi:MAG: hypothetical protein ABEH59_10665 [Halobacteriales archaeon]
MPSGWAGPLEALRQPEYTGQNRCTPCTIVNIGIALVLAVVVAVLLPLEPVGSAVGGGLVLSGAFLAIALRGYLVPGTPWLTRTYFPDRVLEYFDHHRTADVGEATVEPAEVLHTAGAVTPCEAVDDLCLTEAFRTAWHGEMDRLDDPAASRSELAEMFGLAPDGIQLETHGQAFVAVATDHDRHGRQRLGQWESPGAFVADMAGARVLAERFGAWDELSTVDRGRVLNGLRVFLERCPSCGGAVRFGEETVESCCRSREVASVICEACGARLFEAEQPEVA